MTPSPPTTAFHVEVRQFPHVGRAFNLSRDQLDRRILAPWTGGQPLTLDDRRFLPAKARLTIYEGPPLDSGEMGLGRGWGNATRAGREVTARMLEDAQQRSPEAKAESMLEQLKALILQRLAARAVALTEVPALAGTLALGGLASEHLALAERAVWELLHQGRVRMLSGPADRRPIDGTAWRATLLAWETWASGGVSLEAVAAPPA